MNRKDIVEYTRRHEVPFPVKTVREALDFVPHRRPHRRYFRRGDELMLIGIGTFALFGRGQIIWAAIPRLVRIFLSSEVGGSISSAPPFCLGSETEASRTEKCHVRG